MWRPAEPAKLLANFQELEERFGKETALADDQTEILLGILAEIKPEHYRGRRPPPKSYEPTTLGTELFAFRWTSSFFGSAEMYFKFGLQGDGTGRRAYIFSIHPHRTEQNG